MPIPLTLGNSHTGGEVTPQNFGVRLVEWFGELGLFAGRVFHAIFTRPFEGSYLVQNFKLDAQRIKTMGAGKMQDGSDQLEILVYPAGQNAASEAQSPARKK